MKPSKYISAVLALAARPDGVTQKEALEETGFTLDRAARAIRQLFYTRRVVACHLPDDRARNRYFASPEAMAEWQRKNPFDQEAFDARRRELNRKVNRAYRAKQRELNPPKPRGGKLVPGSISYRVSAHLGDEPVKSKWLAEQIGVSLYCVQGALSRLRIAGRCFSAREATEFVYFASDEARNRWLVQREAAERKAKERNKVRAKKAKAKRIKKAIKEKRAVPAPAFVPTKAALPAPVQINRPEPKSAKVQEVDYSKAKITICPSPPTWAKTGVDPSKPVEGGFRAAGVGRYLEAA